MPTQASNRAFSAPPSVQNVAILYGWDPNFVVNSNTGNWVPLPVSGGALAFSPAPATYTPTFSGIIGTGVIIIPTNAKTWTFTLISGSSLFINGQGPLAAPYSINGGLYNTSTTLASSISIGGTGNGAGAIKAMAMWEV